MAMQAPLKVHAPFRLRDLFKPEFAVPSNDPVVLESQPRTHAGRRRRKHFFKPASRIHVIPVQSIETTHNSTIPNETPKISVRLDGSVRQHSGPTLGAVDQAHTNIPQQASSAFTDVYPSTTTQSENISLSPAMTAHPAETDNRIPMLKLRLLKLLKLHRNSSRIDLEHDSTTVPTLDSTSHDATTPAQTLHGANEAATTIRTPIEPATPALELANAVAAPAQAITTPNTSPNEMQHGECAIASIVINAESNIIWEPTNSTRLYSPESGVLVGKLYDLPPPEHLQKEWRQHIRAQLIRDLQTAVAALPPGLSRAEQTYEPELCMYGRFVRVNPQIALRPTIWIRCGSKDCQAKIQDAVDHLSFLIGFPIYVTQHAPRPAGVAPRSIKLTGGTDLLPDDESDSSQPDEINREGYYPQKVGNSSLNIRVQSLLENHDSACGLQVHLQTPNGSSYICTLGGLILLNNTIFGLTTAHAIWDSGLYTEEDTENPSSASKHQIFGPKYRLGDDLTTDNSSGQDGLARSSLAVKHTSWIPAALRAASYGCSNLSNTTIVAGEPSHFGAENRDFALLQIDLDHKHLAGNVYNGSKWVNRVSEDLKARDVELICSSHEVISGHLLDGESFLIDRGGCWETRKIQLDAPLGMYSL
jgi:hypothetical protein